MSDFALYIFRVRSEHEKYYKSSYKLHSSQAASEKVKEKLNLIKTNKRNLSILLSLFFTELYKALWASIHVVWSGGGAFN